LIGGVQSQLKPQSMGWNDWPSHLLIPGIIVPSPATVIAPLM